MDSIITKAVQIAKYELSSCVTDDGIIAGRHHFVDLWARDSLFASLGYPSPKTVETFLRFQRADGAIPYRIFRRAGLLLPNFRSIQSGGFVPDGGLLTMIVAGRERYGKQITKIKEFYKKKYHGDLISEWFQCEWADAVLKRGKVLYTNILYWKAFGGTAIAEKINDTFWNGEFFSDWVDWKRQEYFVPFPNLLAVVWGLATKDQAASILAYAKKKCWNGWAVEENYPSYPWWRIPIQNRLFGLSDYHNRGCMWLQPWLLYAIALHKVGRKKEAAHVFEKIAEKIIEYNGVYEVYEKSGRPVRRFFYQAEHPFAWSAGLFLWAYHDYFTS